jgi:hypothetical protein
MNAELRERWNQMFVHAEEFEAVDKIDEARARSRLALREIREALSRAGNPEARAELELLARRAQRYVERYDVAQAEWNERALERQRHYLKREDEAYHAPLPLPPPPHRD